MNIKSKLFLGIGLLFGMIALLTVISTIYVNKLSGDTENILVANYNTLDYSRQMLIALNENITLPQSQEKFQKNLQKQQANITEVGEKELTDKLTEDYQKLEINYTDSAIITSLRTDLTDIMLLNMQAIQRKSSIAEKTASGARLWIALAGTICFLIAFSLLINLPGNIANPVKELTGSIKEIAAQNYSKRVHFEKQNEFGELAAAFNTMAQKLEEYKNSNIEKLMTEKKRIETLINNMHDPVIGLDEHLKLIFVNEMAINIIGLTQQELVGQSVSELAAKNDLIRSLTQDLTTKGNLNGTGKTAPVNIYANGKESYFEKETLHISILPTGEKNKILTGHVIILRNVTEYKELDFAKTNFIATVSHEFKTPISSIKMSVQLLENEQVGKLNEEQKNLLTGINEDATRLLKITGELLNLTQVEGGNIQLSIIPSDPKEILYYAINANKTQAAQKQIKFDVTCPDNLRMVQADNEKTTWVLINLISNAIRYSYEHSTIFLNISEENNKTIFSVQDTGQGISPQYKDKIFDRYFRVPGTNKEGTGLGLAISKEFIEAQGGQITVNSEFGAGSTFTVTLNSVV